MARSTRRDQPGRESEGGRVVLLTVLGLALLTGAVYAGAYLVAGDKVPVGTRVAGVDIGGHRPATAEVMLRDRLADKAEAPFTVRIGGRVQQVPPQQAGLDVDYAASVRAAGAIHSWRPSKLWAYYTSGGDVTPVVSLDQTRLAALVQRLDLTDGRLPADGSVVFGNGVFHVRPPRVGLALDPKAAGAAFWAAYLSDDPRVDLPLTPTPPAVGEQAVGHFVSRFANPALAAAVTLRLGDRSVRLEPSSYSSLLGARRVGHHLVPRVDATGLARVVDQRLGPDPADAPRDATVALVDGSPQVVKAQPGLAYAPSAMGRALVAAIASDRRTARVPAHRAEASFTDADARDLGITQRLSTFSVHVPSGVPTGPLSAAVARLDGTVLHPGDSVSLRGRLGSAVPEGPAGDALATATFNAVWLGGLHLGSHATHETYPGAGSTTAPLGRDATLDQGQDLAFTDDTRYGVLVSVAIAPPSARRGDFLTVTLWSTPRWSVTSGHDTPTDVVPAGRVVGHGHRCVARHGARGFTVTVTRTFARPGSGEPDRSGSYTAHYRPRPAVVCHR